MSDTLDYLMVAWVIWASYEAFSANRALYKENARSEKRLCRINEMLSRTESAKSNLKISLDREGLDKDKQIKIAIDKLEGLK